MGLSTDSNRHAYQPTDQILLMFAIMDQEIELMQWINELL